MKLFYLGEFLMHPEFDRIVRVAEEKNCHVGVQTNGLLLIRKSIRQRLLDAAPESVGISLDGFDAKSYENARAGGKWEAVRRGISEFVAERNARGLQDKIAIQLTTILPDDTEETRDRITQFLATVADGSLPVSFIGLTTANPTAFFDGEGNLVQYDFKPLQEVFPDYPSCSEPLRKMQILWDGTVSACCFDANGIIRVGQVGLGVDAVWNGPEMRRLQEAHLRQDLADYPLCRQCLGL